MPVAKISFCKHGIKFHLSGMVYNVSQQRYR